MSHFYAYATGLLIAAIGGGFAYAYRKRIESEAKAEASKLKVSALKEAKKIL